MNHINYPQLIKNNWHLITVTVLGLIVLSLALSLIQPLQYRSRVEFLIVQKQNLSMDAYTASRAAEKMASSLATVIKTQSFFDKVISGNYGINRNDFPNEEKDLRKYWQKNILTSVSPESSLLRVDVYQTDKKEANTIASAIASVLINDSSEYYGGGSDVTIKVVNQPLASDYPVRPNILVNSITALILGLILSIIWLVYQENKKANYSQPASYSPSQKNINTEEINPENLYQEIDN